MNKRYKYRFKTYAELLNEFGRNWSEHSGMNNEGYMDYLLGSSVLVPENSIDDMGNVIKAFNVKNECPLYVMDRTWSIMPELIIKITCVVDYKPRKFIYE